MKPMRTAMRSVPASSGGSQVRETLSTLTVSVLAMTYKPPMSLRVFSASKPEVQEEKTTRFRSCRPRSLSFRQLFLFKIDQDLPVVARKHLMGGFGTIETDPQLLSHFKSIARASGAQSQPVSFFAMVENIVDEFVEAPSLRTARRGSPGKHLQRQSRFFRQQHPFIDRQLGHRLHQLIYSFADLPIAVSAQVSDHATDMLEHRQAA